MWVYGAENNERIERSVSLIRHEVTARLPDRVLVALSSVAAAKLAASSRLYVAASGTKKAFYCDICVRHVNHYPQRYLDHIV